MYVCKSRRRIGPFPGQGVASAPECPVLMSRSAVPVSRSTRLDDLEIKVRARSSSDGPTYDILRTLEPRQAEGLSYDELRTLARLECFIYSCSPVICVMPKIPGVALCSVTGKFSRFYRRFRNVPVPAAAVPARSTAGESDVSSTDILVFAPLRNKAWFLTISLGTAS